VTLVQVINELLSRLHVLEAGDGLEQALGAKIARLQELYKKLLMVMLIGTEVRPGGAVPAPLHPSHG
jgi:hypothetical protein